jgi:hypothetical protein
VDSEDSDQEIDVDDLSDEENKSHPTMYQGK